MRRKKTNKTKMFFKILGNTIVVVILLSIALTIYSVFGPKEAYIINSKSATPETPVVESIVISYATSGKFIAVKQTAVPETKEIKPDYTTYSYWLINTADDQVFGPLTTDDDFNAKCQELELNFQEWIGT